MHAARARRAHGYIRHVFYSSNIQPRIPQLYTSARPSSPRTVLTAPERYMSANRNDIRRPSTPVSPPGANGGDHAVAAPQPTVGPANKIIEDKGLDVDFKAITFTTYGGFGKATHDLITKLTSEATDYDFDPWARPSPKSHAYLTFGFALARANARMLINADSKRRSARNRVRTSRQRSASLE